MKVSNGSLKKQIYMKQHINENQYFAKTSTYAVKIKQIVLHRIINCIKHQGNSTKLTALFIFF